MKYFIDNIIEIAIFIFFVLCGLGFFMFISNLKSLDSEKECVSFYQENGYVLDICKRYEDKLVEIDK